jgi:hypothetical protein
MARLGAPGTGFSSRDPSKAVETFAGLASRGRSGGRSSKKTPTYKTVKVSGNTVFINGQGFTVRPQDQESFIQQQTSGSGSSAQAAIVLAKSNEIKRLEEVRKTGEIAKLNKLKLDVAASNQIDRQEKLRILKDIQEQKKAVTFDSKLRTGEILGFSGSGLTVEQERRRANLIKLGIAREMSSRNTKGLYVDPLKTSFFISTTPSPSEKQSFKDYLKQIKQDFTPPVIQTKTAVEKYLNKFKLVQGVKNAASNLNRAIDKLRTEKRPSVRQQWANQVRANKKTFIQRLKKAALIPVRATGRQAGLFALGFSSAIFGFASSLPKLTGAVVAGTPGVVKGAPSFIKKVVTNPKSSAKTGWKFTKTVGSSIKDAGYAFGKLIIVEPGLALGKLTGEIYVMKGIGKGFNVTGKLTGKATRLVNPAFKRIKSGKIIIRKAPAEAFKVRGVTRLLSKRVQKASFKRPFSSVANFLKGRKAGQFKKFTKDPGLILKESTVKSAGKPLSIQAQLAGKEVTAVNAAADQITTWIKRKRIIRKPIPGEAGFPSKIKSMLKKFDAGKNLTNKEFANVNLWLQENVAPNMTLLERSLYLDPSSGLRLSRLGISPDKTASIRDIITGNFKFRSAKPQILVFENAKVQNFPRALESIRRKLLAGNKLTVTETNKLIRFQVKQSGFFKPIGSTIYQGGVELEVTLAPGEIIKRIKKVGFTMVKGKKVSIVTAKVWKPSSSILKQIKLARLGKLSIKQIKKLERIISKATNTKVRIARIGNKLSKLKSKLKGKFTKKLTKKEVMIRDLKRSIKARRKAIRKAQRPPRLIRSPKGISSLPRKIKKRKVIRSKKTVRKIIRPKSKTKPKAREKITKRPKVKPRARSRPQPRPSTRAKPKPTKRPVLRPSARSKPKLTKKLPVAIRLQEGFKRKTLSKKQETFYIKIKRRGKIVNLTPRPLTQRDAKDFLAYSIDNGLERSAWFEPLGRTKKAVKLPAKMVGYFSKNRRKLRPFKVRVGKRRAIRNGYIERSRFGIDTKREKLQMKSTRRKARRKAPKKTTKRKIIKRAKPKKSRSLSARKKSKSGNLAKARAKLKMVNKKKK